jgi:hypothetical protein
MLYQEKSGNRGLPNVELQVAEFQSVENNEKVDFLTLSWQPPAGTHRRR